MTADQDIRELAFHDSVSINRWTVGSVTSTEVSPTNCVRYFLPLPRITSQFRLVCREAEKCQNGRWDSAQFPHSAHRWRYLVTDRTSEVEFIFNKWKRDHQIGLRSVMICNGIIWGTCCHRSVICQAVCSSKSTIWRTSRKMTVDKKQLVAFSFIVTSFWQCYRLTVMNFEVAWQVTLSVATADTWTGGRGLTCQVMG